MFTFIGTDTGLIALTVRLVLPALFEARVKLLVVEPAVRRVNAAVLPAVLVVA